MCSGFSWTGCGFLRLVRWRFGHAGPKCSCKRLFLGSSRFGRICVFECTSSPSTKRISRCFWRFSRWPNHGSTRLVRPTQVVQIRQHSRQVSLCHFHKIPQKKEHQKHAQIGKFSYMEQNSRLERLVTHAYHSKVSHPNPLGHRRRQFLWMLT